MPTKKIILRDVVTGDWFVWHTRAEAEQFTERYHSPQNLICEHGYY